MPLAFLPSPQTTPRPQSGACALSLHLGSSGPDWTRPQEACIDTLRGGWAPGPGRSLLRAQAASGISRHRGPARVTLSQERPAAGGTLGQPYEGELVCLPFSVGVEGWSEAGSLHSAR